MQVLLLIPSDRLPTNIGEQARQHMKIRLHHEGGTTAEHVSRDSTSKCLDYRRYLILSTGDFAKLHQCSPTTGWRKQVF